MNSVKNIPMNFFENDTISLATKRNWERLNTSNQKERCSARANKKMSEKHIIPKESFDDIENIPKVENLANHIKIAQYDVKTAIFSLGMNLLNNQNITDENLNYLKSEYNFKIIHELLNIELPNESDLLGIVYQCLQTEGEKNIKGSYYTPKKVVSSMVSDIEIKTNDKVLDPCCGSSVFLLNIPNIKPEQIFGVDIDPIAVMISKIKYFLKFPQISLKPQIFVADFLELPNLLNNRNDNFQEIINENKFDYIITNPPWGGSSTSNRFVSNDILSNEMFSLFLVKSFSELKNNGNMRFLLPCSILNVKTHQDIRKYLLKKTDLKKIVLHPGAFSGVMTQYISLETEKKNNVSKSFVVLEKNIECIIDKKTLKKENYFVINAKNNKDNEIIEKILQKKKYDLSNATWALGIVTGDNKGKLQKEKKDGLEPIFTGKEISPFKLKKAQKYISYDRNNFQQVAKDEIYRAEKKLVYKFISKKLVFSIDDSRNLFLNSANILIPKIPNMSINSVAAFLNSELYQYLYQKLFGEIKILKSSLTALPFIEITEEQDKELSSKVEKILESENIDYSDLQKYIYNLFEIDEKQIGHIKGELYGNAN